ncbi:MAG: C39 family peptidase [Clostridium sp.]|nr:C39 family peptidase [Clostridium sp.]
MKKKKKPEEKKENRFERIITGSVVVLSLSVTVSLFAYFRPFTLKDVTNRLQLLYQGAEASLSQFKRNREAPHVSLQTAAAPEISGAGSADSEITPSSEHEESSPYSPESIPFLTPSTDLGEISDLNTDLTDYEYEEETIYMAMLDTAIGPMLYYNQGDSRWNSYLYGGLDSIGGYGCGPTAVAMLVNSFTPSTVTPVEIADWSAANGYFAHGSGSYHSLIPDGLSAFGLSVESVTDRTPENVRELLRDDRLLVALMGRGSLARVGHFIIITNSCENGNVHIADPNSLSNSTVEWDLQQLMDELKGSYDSGGPLWSVGIGGHWEEGES